MTKTRINTRQAAVLGYIKSNPDADTQTIADKAPQTNRFASSTYDATHSLLSRLEKRMLVERSGKTTHATWKVTASGLRALKDRG